MHVDVIPLAEMSAPLQRRWSSIQETSPHLGGPCFRPELFMAIARAHSGVYVAVANEGPAVGFLPFLRQGRCRIARPVPMCDYQAIVGEAGQRWDVQDILRKARLTAWEFDSLVDAGRLKAPPDTSRQGDSPRVVLAEGFDAYLAKLKDSGKSLRSFKNSARLAQRDLGELRFVPRADCSNLLHTLLEWKAQRFNEGRPVAGWVNAALQHLLGDEGQVCGMLSALYAGDVLVAAHFGIRCQGILHYWFPGFNPECSQFSPGKLLLYNLLSHLSEMDCHTIDFGPGGEAYKYYLNNQVLPTTHGCFELPSLATLVRRGARRLQESVRTTTWLHTTLRPAVRMIRRLRFPGPH